MQTRFLLGATVAVLALVSGCAADATRSTNVASNSCRDPRLLLACHQTDPAGAAPSIEEAESASNNKGKLLARREMEHLRTSAPIGHGSAPPSFPRPPPEPVSYHPPPHH